MQVYGNPDTPLNRSVKAIVEKKKQEGVELTSEDVDAIYKYIAERIPPQVAQRMFYKEPFFAEFFADLERDA